MKLKNCGVGLGRKTLVLFIIMLLGLCDPNISTSDAGHFGFKGGFRGGFGHSKFKRSFSRKSFGRVGKFHSFGFRGFNSFGRSKFNSLAFRGRRFGFNSFNKFGKFNRFGSFNRFNSFSGFKSPRFNSFAFSHFPSSRFHSGFGNFQPTKFVAAKPKVIVSPCGSTYTLASPVSPYIASRPVFTPTIASSSGWGLLADSKISDASNAFASNINSNFKPGESRVGFALAAAASGNLDLGVEAMKRAFALNSTEVGSLMFDDKLLPMVEDLTREYETRMETVSSKNDDAFMLAAMYQMQGDPEMASMAMDYIKYANSETGTANLASLIKTEMDSIPMTHGNSWDLLAEGRSLDAINSFVQDINADSSSGVAKLGYGLAYAETGNLEHAAWAIRRAFEIDREGVSDIMLDGKLRPTLQKIVDKFENSDSTLLNKDNSLVLGTLYQLMGDIEVAQFIVDKGQLDDSIYLVKMIKDENKMEKEMVQESVPKLEKMDEEYPVFGQELAAETESVFLGPKLEADLRPEVPSEIRPVVLRPELVTEPSPELPPDFDAIDKTLSMDTATQEQPLVLEGPKVVNQ